MKLSKLCIATLTLLALTTAGCMRRATTSVKATGTGSNQILASDKIPDLIASVDEKRIEQIMQALASSKYDDIVARILKVQKEPESGEKEETLSQLREEFDRVAAAPAPGDYIITRSSFSDKSPTGRGIGQAAAWIENAFKGLSPRLLVKKDCFDVQAQRVCNVLAELPASNHSPSAPVIVLGAHYDSRGTDNADGKADAPGATDNASGISVVLETARIAVDHHFASHLVFIAFAAEEQSLQGSTYQAKRLLAEERRIIAMINNDLVGNSSGNRGGIENEVGEHRDGSKFLRIFTDTNFPGAKELWLGAKEQINQYSDKVGIEPHLLDAIDRRGRGSDHKPFLQRGVSAIRLATGLEDYSHQHTNVSWLADGSISGDLLAFADVPYIARVARANLAILLPLAIKPHE
jgi:Zn-dependent M28 family amino/carboxypeptidase